MQAFFPVKELLPVKNVVRTAVNLPRLESSIVQPRTRAVLGQSINQYNKAAIISRREINATKLDRLHSPRLLRQVSNRTRSDFRVHSVLETETPTTDSPEEPAWLKGSADAAAEDGKPNANDAQEGGGKGVLTDKERLSVQNAWGKLMRWSRIRNRREAQEVRNLRESAQKVVVLGGGSFGTAMAAILARNHEDIEVVLLVRDEKLVESVNENRRNARYFPEHELPSNVTATTDPAAALDKVQYIVHAIPVQASSAFLVPLADLIPPSAPVICLSKGLEVGTGRMMADVVLHALDRPQPLVVLSGPSFAVELMNGLPTMLVAASEDPQLAQETSSLFSSQSLRVNISDDVTGVEVAGALKNVLAIAAGIVEGLDLGNNAIAALTAQGCGEIRRLAEKMGAKPATLSGPAGVGDIMLTCFVNLSRNRTVGVRLGAGESLESILKSGRTAEGVATAGVVISLAAKYNVSLPVLTAVSRILDDQTSPRTAVLELMQMPQVPDT